MGHRQARLHDMSLEATDHVIGESATLSTNFHNRKKKNVSVGAWCGVKRCLTQKCLVLKIKNDNYRIVTDDEGNTLNFYPTYIMEDIICECLLCSAINRGTIGQRDMKMRVLNVFL